MNRQERADAAALINVRFIAALDAAILAAVAAPACRSDPTVKAVVVTTTAQQLSVHLGCALGYLKEVAAANPTEAATIDKGIASARAALEAGIAVTDNFFKRTNPGG